MKKTTRAVHRGIFEEYFTPHLSKSQLRKIEIIEAAIRLYSSKGIDHVTYELLSQEARASRGLVQHYYPDLNALVFETMKYVRARLQRYAIEAFVNESTATRMIECYVTSVFNWATKYPNDARVWILFLYYSSFKQNFKKLNTDLVQMGFDRICGILEIGVRNGEFRVKDVYLQAKLIQLTINGGFIELMSERKILKSPDIRQATINQCLFLALGEERPSKRKK